MEPNVAEAVRALTEKPLFATSAERVAILAARSYQTGDPQPVLFAATFADLLDHVSTPLEPYDRIAGRTVDRELSPAEEAAFQAFLARDRSEDPYRTALLDRGHGTLDWDALVRLGLPGLRRRAAEKLATLDPLDPKDRDGRVFLSSMLSAYDALIRYLHRYAEAARERGMNALADRLRAAADEVPQSFPVALQLLWTVTMIYCAYLAPNPTLSLGRLDQVLLPLYRKGIAEGSLTREEAAAYVTDYYCKHNLIMGRGEHQIGGAANSTTFDRICNFDAPQYLHLAGTDERGDTAANELTDLFAACVVPAFKNPVVVVRYVPGMAQDRPALWKTLCEKALQSASLMFYNDSDVRAAFARVGVPAAAAGAYEHFGCNWCSLGPRSAWMNCKPRAKEYGVFRDEAERRELDVPFMRVHAPNSWPDDFVQVLRGIAESGAPLTVEALYAAFGDRVRDYLTKKAAWALHEREARSRRPAAALTFGDLFFPTSVDRLGCYTSTADYLVAFASFQMFGTVVDCFTAVEEVVIERKVCTPAELLAALDADFVGYERLRDTLRAVPKYGTGSERSRYHTRRLATLWTDCVAALDRELVPRGVVLTPNVQSDTWHLKYGETYGATPDGRSAGQPFSQNSRPSFGACTRGVTAMLNAMLEIPADSFVSGALNLDVDRSDFSGPDGEEAFSVLLSSYLDRGGLHAQVSCLSVDDLRDARIHPDRHRDLRVRVTGYSGIFVDFPERLQDDVIRRFGA